MAIDPTPPNWGTVIGRFTSVWGDGNDAGDAPDLVAMSGGVTLTPTVAWLRLTDGTLPVTVVTRPVVCTLDNDGIMIGPDGLPGVRVMASNAPGVTPTGIQYRVSFQLKGKTGWPLERQPDSFLISVPAGTTTDLSDVVPAPTVTPVLTIVSRADRDLAETAAATAQQAAADAIAAAASVGTGSGGVAAVPTDAVMTGATGQAVLTQVFTLLAAQFNGAGRMRLYATEVARTADTSRAAGAPYAGTGLLYEYVSTAIEYDAYQAFTIETATDKTVHWLIDGGITATLRYLPGA